MRVLRYFYYLLLVVVLFAAAGWYWLLYTAPGARFVWDRAEAALGGALSADTLSGDLAAGLTLEGFGLTLPGVEITADRASAAIDIDLMPLSVALTDATVESLFVDVRKSDSPRTDPPDVRQVLRQLRLPIWLRIGSLAIDDARLGLPGREQPIVIDRVGLVADWRDRIFVDRLEMRTQRASASASGMLELTGGQSFDLAVVLVLRPALAAADDEVAVRAGIAGNPDKFTVDADGEAGIGGRDAHAFSIAGTGSMQALDVESFDVSGDDLRASGSGRILLATPLSIRAAIDLEHADPSPFIERWPAEHPLSGSLDISFEPGHLELEDTHFVVDRADTRVTLAGVIDLDEQNVRGDLEWQRVAWPLGADAPDFSSRKGRLGVAGTVDDWRADGSFTLTLRGLEETTLDLEGRGNRTRAGLEIANAVLFGGRVAGSASVAWTDERPWAVNLYAIDIDTGSIDADWPGRLSGLLRAAGNVDRDWLRAAVVDIDGELRARQFKADGGIEVDDGRFVAHELSLDHGDSRFDLDGAYWSATGIRFDISIVDIGHYLDDASGAVSGSGRLSLYEPSPFLRLDASSEFLRVGELIMSGLRIEDRGDGKALQAAIRAREITVGDEHFIEPRMLLEASPDAQIARISARYAEFAFDVRLDGAFDSWKQPSAWRGLVNTLEVDAGEAGRIELLDAAAVSVSANAVDLSSLCLAGPGDERLCMEASWIERRQLEVDATLTSVPVALVNRFVDTGYTFDQALSGDVNWSFIRDEGLGGGGELAISAGRIVSDRRPGLAIRTGTGRLGFDVRDGRLLSGEASLPLPGTGAINATVEIADLGDVKNSGVAGRLEADLDDIALLAVLLPDFDAPDGRLRATIDVAGTVAEPLVTGSANLDGGRVDYLPLGLELRDADLAVDLDADRFVSVSGSVRAGEGRATIEPLPFGANDRPPGVHVAIRGDNLTLVSVPDVSAQANLDMQAGYDGKHLTLGGRVDVPRARVQPETLPSAKQTVSEDVVIVAGALPGETSRRAGDGLEMHGELAVALGPDVRVRVDVATAMVSGTTTFIWEGDPMPVADGRYIVTGEVQAFGILLRIDEGTVRFPKVAANNPSLRIRAEREIFGNTQVRQAGVLIDGTLARPTLTPYTDPPTTEERALTLLVTGSDFNLEEGVGAIDFGTYIAPRLYVSYGISLFGQDNVISARYDLTEGFGIRATSGQTDSGVDLIYRIER